MKRNLFMTSAETKIDAAAAAGTTPRTRKLALLGCGKMGTILLQAFLERGLVNKDDVIATVQHTNKCRSLSEAMAGVAFSVDNRAAAATAPIVLICVKPQTTPQLLQEIASALRPNTLVISVATGVTLAFMQQHLG